MPLSNAERQRRFRERVKAKLQSGSPTIANAARTILEIDGEGRLFDCCEGDGTTRQSDRLEKALATLKAALAGQ